MRTAAPIGGQVGYRWQAGTFVFGVEAQGNWADFKGSNASTLFPRLREQHQDRRVRPVHRSGRLRLEQRPALRQGRRRCDLEPLPHQHGCRRARSASTGDDTRWGGTIGVGLEYGFAPNWSVGVEYDHMFMQDKTYNFTTPAGACVRQRSRPSGRRSRHRSPELQVRRPGHREVLISRALTSAQDGKPRALPGAFFVGQGAIWS